MRRVRDRPALWFQRLGTKVTEAMIQAEVPRSRSWVSDEAVSPAFDRETGPLVGFFGMGVSCGTIRI